MPEQITMTDFAKMLGISRRTLYRYMELQLLYPRRNVIGQPYFLRSDLQPVREKILGADTGLCS